MLWTRVGFVHTAQGRIMKTLSLSFGLLATSLAFCCGNAFAQSDAQIARPMFTTLPHNAPGHRPPIHPASTLTQWNGSFTDLTGHLISYTMVGTNPATNNAPATIPVVIVPIKMVYGANNGNMTFDPNAHTVSNGKTVTANTIASPLFQTGV